MKDSIPESDLKNGGLYRVSARNFSYGVYVAEGRCFIGIRNKFGRDYLDAELDYETGPPFGTCTPLEYLCDCPVRPLKTGSFEDNAFKNNVELFDWIQTTKVQYANNQA